jgi:hypothetical protein
LGEDFYRSGVCLRKEKEDDVLSLAFSKKGKTMQELGIEPLSRSVRTVVRGAGVRA